MKVLLLAASALATIAGATAHAQDSNDSDKLDIKKLEQKYWSAKDDDFSVVQNRSFTKAGRYSVSLLAGIPINDPYSYGSLGGVALGYHFNERHGLEIEHLSASFRDNDATDQFVTDHGTVPNHNVLTSSTTLQYNFIPLYAKMSFLDRSIIYFDMGLSVGFGTTAFEQQVSTGNRAQTASHYMYSIYQHYFLNENIAIKVEYRNTFTNEERLRYKLNPGDPESSRSLAEKQINDSALLLGITYFIGGGQQ